MQISHLIFTMIGLIYRFLKWNIQDQNTDEFIINTPNIKAAKFWPGDLGNFSTHAIVFAKMIIDGNPYGVLPFIV